MTRRLMAGIMRLGRRLSRYPWFHQVMHGKDVIWVTPTRWLGLAQRTPTVTHLNLPLGATATGLAGVTIAFLADLHVGGYYSLADLAGLVEQVNQLRPDVVALGGDYVTYYADVMGEVTPILGRLSAPLGIFAINGNHDWWTDEGIVLGALRQVGVRVLVDEAAPVRVKGARFWLIGLDDIWKEREGKKPIADLAQIVAGIPAGEPRLLLVHNPDYLAIMPPVTIDLVLAGHTHGGQICLPGGRALLAPSAYGRRYLAGLAHTPHAPAYISRGIGAMTVPLRWHCPPEIVVVHLISGNGEVRMVSGQYTNTPIHENVRRLFFVCLRDLRGQTDFRRRNQP